VSSYSKYIKTFFIHQGKNTLLVQKNLFSIIPSQSTPCDLGEKPSRLFLFEQQERFLAFLASAWNDKKHVILMLSNKGENFSSIYLFYLIGGIFYDAVDTHLPYNLCIVTFYLQRKR